MIISIDIDVAKRNFHIRIGIEEYTEQFFRIRHVRALVCSVLFSANREMFLITSILTRHACKTDENL